MADVEELRQLLVLRRQERATQAAELDEKVKSLSAELASVQKERKAVQTERNKLLAAESSADEDMKTVEMAAKLVFANFSTGLVELDESRCRS